MTTKIHMSCDGCDAEHSVEVKRTFESFNGKGYGFGTYHVPSISEAVEPTGWIWSDIINCTYCPQCWAEIISEDDEGSPYQTDASNPDAHRRAGHDPIGEEAS